MRRLNALLVVLLALCPSLALAAGMTAAGLSAAICAQLPAPTDAAKQKAFCDGLAAGIVNYIQANAQVTLPPASVVTVGSFSTQTGPQAPVIMTVQ
jgi:hypothetical protein